MGTFTKHLAFIVFILINSSWATIDDEPIPLKMTKNLFPKKYEAMSLQKFRTEPTESPTTTEVFLETTTPENADILQAEKMAELTTSEEEQLQQMTRKRKSATTTFCVEIRPNNPYKRSFKICESPQQIDNTYGPPSAPGTDYGKRVLFLPHVPVAEPYHVPTQKVHHVGGGYRTSNRDFEGTEDDMSVNFDARTAFYEEAYDPYDKSYDFHKKKEINYLPVMTKTFVKTKPITILKVLKNVKKDKIKYDEDDYGSSYDSHGSIYDRNPHYSSRYGPNQGNRKENQHGLVITCQPSAVGYTGSQGQLDLAKQIEQLKNLYAQKENAFSHSKISPSYTGNGNGNGYVAPDTYRSQSFQGRTSENEQEMMPSEKWQKLDVDPTLQSSGKWTPSQMQEEKEGVSLRSSNGPDPTMEALQTIQAFRNAHRNFAIQPMDKNDM